MQKTNKLCLVDITCCNIERLFLDYQSLLNADFQKRLKRSISILHHSYLLGACKEAQAFLQKHKTQNLFFLIMNMYNKRRKTHKAKFLLLHCFENALRSFCAVAIADFYNTMEKDNWFLKYENTKLHKKIKSILNKRHLDIKAFSSTFELFDIFTLGDLIQIVESHYSLFESTFKQSKSYKNQELPCYNKSHLIQKLDQIRQARNEIYHNKPSKIKFEKDLEILLLRLEYNLKDATKELQNIINLRYHYE